MPKDTFFNLPATKREGIEAVAIAEFAANPFPYASINTIVDQAGIAKGSFYQYFEGKADLYQHILSLIRQAKLRLAAQMTSSSNNQDFFTYLRWMFAVALQFELRQAKLAKIERDAFFNGHTAYGEDSEGAVTVGGSAYFNDFLAQGILHEDIATWVDTDLASALLGSIYFSVSPILLASLGEQTTAVADGSLDIRELPAAQDLLDNLIDLLEAGLARDPQIRKDFYSK